jgi:hypothetical protein
MNMRMAPTTAPITCSGTCCKLHGEHGHVGYSSTVRDLHLHVILSMRYSIARSCAAAQHQTIPELALFLRLLMDPTFWMASPTSAPMWERKCLVCALGISGWRRRRRAHAWQTSGIAEHWVPRRCWPMQLALKGRHSSSWTGLPFICTLVLKDPKNNLGSSHA